MRKTVSLQPYVKFLVTSLFVTSFVVIYSHLFGIPGALKVAMSPIYLFFAKVITTLERTLISIYGSILTILPMRRRRQTGFDVVLGYMNASWLRFVAFIRLYIG